MVDAHVLEHSDGYDAIDLFGPVSVVHQLESDHVLELWLPGARPGLFELLLG